MTAQIYLYLNLTFNYPAFICIIVHFSSIGNSAENLLAGSIGTYHGYDSGFYLQVSMPYKKDESFLAAFIILKLSRSPCR